MTLSISNPIQSTHIFIVLLIVSIILSYRKKGREGLTLQKTQELKGFAILTVLFAHIGYFLSNQHQFLFPLSILAGVGVNMFLFLSGYGLTISSLKKQESVMQFYTRRVLKLLIPFWIVLCVFLISDFLFLHIRYPKDFVLQALFGIFTHANIFTDLNSPFWYMTFILFCYLLYPILFSKKYPWLSALLIYVVLHTGIKMNPVVLQNVIGLYKIHDIAFPLGIFAAWFFTQSNVWKKILGSTFHKKLEVSFWIREGVFIFLLMVCTFFAGYLAIHSGVGASTILEQNISILTMCVIIFIFFLKKNEFRILTLLGMYSYEIYLIHWPVLYRYNFLYGYVPAWVATVLYIVLFIALGWILRYLSTKISGFCLK